MKGDELFALGGVWRHWCSPDRRVEMDTFAVITTEPNELVAAKTGHDRMPIIIERWDHQRWLEPRPFEQPPIDLIRPYDSDQMKAWRVDRRINNVRNNEASLGKPIQDDDEQLGMFLT